MSNYFTHWKAKRAVIDGENVKAIYIGREVVD